MYRELNEITESELTDKCFDSYMNNPYRVLGVLCNTDKEKVSTLVKRVNELKEKDNLSKYEYDVDSRLIKREKINVTKINDAMKNIDIYKNKIFSFANKKYVQNLLTVEVYKEFFETRNVPEFDCFIANYFYMLVVDRKFESVYEWDQIFDYINKVLMFNIDSKGNKTKFKDVVDQRFSNVEMCDDEYLVKFKKSLDENLIVPIIDAINEIEDIKVLGDILRYTPKYENESFRKIEMKIYYKVLDLIKITNDEINRNITVKKAGLEDIVKMSKDFIKDYYEIVYNLPCGEKDNIVLQQIRDKYYVQVRSFINLLLFNGKYLEIETVAKDMIKCSGKVYKEEAKTLYENVSEIIKGYKAVNKKLKQLDKNKENLDIKEILPKDEEGCIRTSVAEISTTYYKAVIGNVDAEYALGIMISEGKLGAYLTKAEELKFGLKWIEKAANHKNVKAMKYLYMYNVNQANNCDKKTYKGKKVFKTKVARADKWLQKLIEQNDEDAKTIADSDEYKNLIKDINKQEGCYIATAVYGSYDDEHVRVLRNYRDRCLLESGIGTRFVELYYKYSPVYAEKLKNRKVINKIVKGCLNIFVKTLNKKYKD